jgi:hypothetical protein
MTKEIALRFQNNTRAHKNSGKNSRDVVMVSMELQKKEVRGAI